VPGKSKREAIDSFFGFFKESLACITDAYVQPIQLSNNLYTLTYEPPAELLCGTANRTLSVTQLFSAVAVKEKDEYKVRTRQYSYALNEIVDGEVVEVVSYHWHPDESDVRYPHLHITAVPRVHFPMSRISIERFIRMLIHYYEIEPMMAASEWKPILKKNQEAFDKMATWK
jgi:hypothetical protein